MLAHPSLLYSSLAQRNSNLRITIRYYHVVLPDNLKDNGGRGSPAVTVRVQEDIRRHRVLLPRERKGKPTLSHAQHTLKFTLKGH